MVRAQDRELSLHCRPDRCRLGNGVEVTNINVVFASMVGFGFATNDFWHENLASSNRTTGPLFWPLDSLPANRSIKIPPISFADTNYGAGFGLIGICINASDMPQQLTRFWLTFVSSNFLSKPVFSQVNTSVVVTNNEAIFSVQSAMPTNRWRGIPLW